MTCAYLSICFFTASTTLLFECPIEQADTPATKSRYFLPFTSVIYEPLASDISSNEG